MTSRSLAWTIRNAVPPSLRSAARRVADATLRPVGSVGGAVTDERVVALTFDDGPDPRWTEGVVEALGDAGATATFFALCDKAEAEPTLVRAIADAGHEIGLHGPDHRSLPTLGWRTQRAWLAEGRARLEAVSGTPVRWFRPPYGAQSLASFVAARREGLEVVVWGPHGEDWVEQAPEAIGERLAAAVAPGDVVLLHDGFMPRTEAQNPEPLFDRGAMVRHALAALRDRGYRATSVGGLLDGRPVRRTAWFRP